MLVLEKLLVSDIFLVNEIGQLNVFRMVLILMFFSCGWKFICGFIDVVFSVFGSEICLLLSLFCS